MRRRVAACLFVALTAAAFPSGSRDRRAAEEVSRAQAVPPARSTLTVNSQALAAGPAERQPRRAPTDADPLGFVMRHGSGLFLDAKPYRFTGLNAYELTSWYAVSQGCGAEVRDLDRFFRSLRPHSMVRVSANQQLVVDKRNGRIDFTPIDRVVKAAERHGHKLILALASQDGSCDDGHWKDSAWYAGGFRKVFDVTGAGLRRSFWQWLLLVVPRYAKSPAVGMWQLVGEPEASDCAGTEGSVCYGRRQCAPGATARLRHFFDTAGAELKRLDPDHLLATGSLSTSQCGFANGGYRTILDSDAVDVANYHDYDHDATPLPAGARAIIEAARVHGKPIVIDEVGVRAGRCGSLGRRTSLLMAKARAGFAAGISGFLAWNWEPRTLGSCTMAIVPGDPFLAVLRRYAP